MILVFCITCWSFFLRINYPRCFGTIISKQIFINQSGMNSDKVTYCTVRAADSFFVEKFKDLTNLFFLNHHLSCVHNQFSYLPFGNLRSAIALVIYLQVSFLPPLPALVFSIRH